MKVEHVRSWVPSAGDLRQPFPAEEGVQMSTLEEVPTRPSLIASKAFEGSRTWPRVSHSASRSVPSLWTHSRSPLPRKFPHTSLLTMASPTRSESRTSSPAPIVPPDWPGALSARDRQSLLQEGYLLIPGVADAHTVQAIRAAWEHGMQKPVARGLEERHRGSALRGHDAFRTARGRRDAPERHGER